MFPSQLSAPRAQYHNSLPRSSNSLYHSQRRNTFVSTNIKPKGCDEVKRTFSDDVYLSSALIATFRFRSDYDPLLLLLLNLATPPAILNILLAGEENHERAAYEAEEPGPTTEGELTDAFRQKFLDLLGRVNHVSVATRTYQVACEALGFQTGRAILIKSAAFKDVTEVLDYDLKTWQVTAIDYLVELYTRRVPKCISFRRLWDWQPVVALYYLWSVGLRDAGFPASPDGYRPSLILVPPNLMHICRLRVVVAVMIKRPAQ